MCILQAFEAITPNTLARTVEMVEGGGLSGASPENNVIFEAIVHSYHGAISPYYPEGRSLICLAGCTCQIQNLIS
jgi:hypothetical protein